MRTWNSGWMADDDAPYHMPTTPVEPGETPDLLRGFSGVAAAPGSPGSQVADGISSLMREPSGQYHDELSLGHAGSIGLMRRRSDPFGEIEMKPVFDTSMTAMASLNSQIQEVARHDVDHTPQAQQGMNVAHVVRPPSTSHGPMTPATPSEPSQHMDHESASMNDVAGAMHTSKLSAFAAQPLAHEPLRPGPGGALKQEEAAHARFPEEGAQIGQVGGSRPPTHPEPYQQVCAAYTTSPQL